MVFAQTNSLVTAHLKRQSWVTQLIVVKRNPERCIGFHVRGKRVGAQQRAPVVLGCLAGNNTAHNLQSPHAKLIHFYFLRTSCQVLWTALMFRWIYCWDKTKQNPNWLALFSEYVSIHRRDPLQIFLLSTEDQAIWPQHTLGDPDVCLPPHLPSFLSSLSQLYRAGCFLSGSTEEDLLPLNLLPVSPASLGKPNFAPFHYQLVPAVAPWGPAALSWTSQKGNFLPITSQTQRCGTVNSPTLICCPWPHNMPLALLTGRQSVEMLLTWAVQPRNQKEDFSFLLLPPVKALKRGCLFRKLIFMTSSLINDYGKHLHRIQNVW